MGYSHPVDGRSAGVTSVLDGQNIIKTQGIDKESRQYVEIRSKRKPEPYSAAAQTSLVIRQASVRSLQEIIEW